MKDLNSVISEVVISIINDGIQSLFKIYDLIRGVNIFVSGSNALYKDFKKVFVSEYEER